MKPDREQCLKMAREAGGLTSYKEFDFDVLRATIYSAEAPVLLSGHDLERLIHAAWDAAEKVTAERCANMCYSPHGNPKPADSYGQAHLHCRTAILSRFNLPESTGASHD